MHPGRPTPSISPRAAEDLGRLAAGAQLAAVVSAWLLLLPVVPIYAGGVWASEAIRRAWSPAAKRR